MTKASLFGDRLRNLIPLSDDSLDQMDMLMTILNIIDPEAMFDLETKHGLMIIFTDGSRATVFGMELN